MTRRIVRYHHVTHNVMRSHADVARRFYGDVLGLPEIPPVGDPTNQRLIWFQVGNQQLHLVLCDSVDPASTRHIALAVEDFDGVIERLHRSGARFEESGSGELWRLRADGSKCAFCYDPDGNRIELVEAR